MTIPEVKVKSPGYYKNSAVFLGLSLLSAALNYAYYPVIARFLSADEFGAVQALIAVLLQVGAFFAGLSLATIFLVKKLETEEAKKAIEVMQKTATGLFLLATVLVAIFQTAVLNFLNIDDRLYIFILAADLITTVPFIIAFGYLQAKRQFLTAGMLQVTVVTIKLLSGALLAWQYGAVGALAGIAVGQVLGMFIFWTVGNFYKIRLWDHRALGSLVPPTISELKRTLPHAKQALAIFLVNVVLVVYISFAIIVARHYFSPQLSGLFSGAVVMASAIVFVCLPLTGVLLPHLNIKSLAASRADLFKSLVMVTAVVGLSFVVLTTFSSQLLAIFGNEYESMSYLIPSLATMMALVAFITLLFQVSAFYTPIHSAVLVVSGLLLLTGAVFSNHSDLEALASTMTVVFATILLVASLQIIWIYRYETR